MVVTSRLLMALLLLLCVTFTATAKDLLDAPADLLNKLDALLGNDHETAKQPAAVLFSDDFTRDKLGPDWVVVDDPAPSTPSAWTVGKGALIQRSNIYRSDREYDFHQGTHITTGSAKWTDYHFAAQVTSNDDDGFGLLIRYVDKDNYYRVLTVQDGTNRGPFRRLEKFEKGKRTVLAEEKKGFVVGKTYAVTFSAVGHRLTVRFDDETPLTATDATFSTGKIGFLTYANSGFLATAVRVTTEPAKPIALTAPAVTLTGPSGSTLLANTYPTTNVRMQYGIRYSKPGVIIDTVGINAAPVGSFALSVDAHGKVTFHIYNPGQQSPARVANGWHLVTSTALLPPNTDGDITVDVAAKDVTLSLNGKVEKKVALAAQLSGRPIYAGDFPGDDAWGPKYNIHPAMTGTITMKYLGVIPGAGPPETTKPTGGSKLPPQDQGIPVLVPTDAPATVDAGVKQIEAAFRSGNLEAVLKLVTPVKHAIYKPVFEAHRTELPRIANLLATRKLVATSGALAEYTVTDAGRTFHVYFERIDGIWCLLTL